MSVPEDKLVVENESSQLEITTYEEVSTLGDGNCAFNGFALGLCELILTSKIECSKEFEELCRQASSEEEFDIKKWLKTRNDKEIQKKIQPILRHISVTFIVNNYDEVYCNTYQTLLYDAFKNQAQDDNFKYHAHIKEKFEEIKNKKEKNDEKNRKDLLDWWEKIGKQGYFNNIKRTAKDAGDRATWGGEPEIDALAQYFGINVCWRKATKATGEQLLGIKGGIVRDLELREVQQLEDLQIGNRLTNSSFQIDLLNRESLLLKINPVQCTDEKLKKEFEEFIEAQPVQTEIDLPVSIGDEKVSEELEKLLQELDVLNEKKLKCEKLHLIMDAVGFELIKNFIEKRNNELFQLPSQFETLEKNFRGRKILIRKEKNGKFFLFLCNSDEILQKQRILNMLKGLDDILRKKTLDAFKESSVVFKLSNSATHWTYLRSRRVIKNAHDIEQEIIKKLCGFVDILGSQDQKKIKDIFIVLKEILEKPMDELKTLKEKQVGDTLDNKDKEELVRLTIESNYSQEKAVEFLTDPSGYLIKLIQQKGNFKNLKLYKEFDLFNLLKGKFDQAKQKEVFNKIIQYLVEKENKFGKSKPSSVLAGESEYSASGVKHALHGTIYQLKLLMLFLKRGIKKPCFFKLATEMDDAEKFDDVVFRYFSAEDGKWKYRFLQAKHKLEGKITVHDLLTEKDDEFSLQKYFISYQKIRKDIREQFKDGELEDFTICTNVDFDWGGGKKSKRLLKLKKDTTFDPVTEMDDILNVSGKNQAMRYRFKKNFPGKKEELYLILRQTSETIRLVNKFTKCVLEKKELNLRDPLFKIYHKALATAIIDIKRPVPIYLINKKEAEGFQKALKKGKEIFIVEEDEKKFKIIFWDKNGKEINLLISEEDKVGFLTPEQNKALLAFLLGLDLEKDVLDIEKNGELYQLICEIVIFKGSCTHLPGFRSDFIQGDPKLSPQARNFRQLFIERAKVLKNIKNEADLWERINEQELQLSSAFGRTLELTKNPQLVNLNEFVQEIVVLLTSAEEENGLVGVKIDKRKKGMKDNKDNIDLLAGYVFVTSGNETVQFSKMFLQNGTLPGNLQEFRNLLKEQLEDTCFDFEELQKFQFFIGKDFQTCEEGQLNATESLPDDVVPDGDIEDFLTCLVFAVFQPNEKELGEIIDGEIGAEFNLIDSEFITSQFQKEMLDWMKEKKGRFLTDQDGRAFFVEAEQKINKLILIGPTLEYRARLDKSKIVFKESFDLQKFLKSENQVLNFIASQSTWLSSLKVYKSLRLLLDYQRDDNYVFIRLKSCLSLEDRLLSSFRDSKCNLLIIECNKPNGKETLELFNRLIKVLSENAIKKIILIAVEDVYLKTFETAKIKCLPVKDESNDFSDLDPGSQAAFKAKEIIFQGQKTNANDLINAENFNKVVNAEALVEFINSETLIVDDVPPRLTDFESACYIDRKLNRSVTIDLKCLCENLSDFFAISGSNVKDIQSLLPKEGKGEKEEKACAFEEIDRDAINPARYILLTATKELADFNQVCTYYANQSIHWLEINESGAVWKKSYGIVSGLRQYVITSKIKKHKPHEISDNVVVIAAEPGMGKSVELTHLLQQTKAANPNLWVIKIDLKKHEEHLNIIDFSTIEAVVNFLAEIRQLTIIAKNLLEIQLECQGNIALFIDGFDEVGSEHQVKVIQFVKILKAHAKVEKIWIATRPHMKNELEDIFSIFAYRLKQVSEKKVIEFLKKFWRNNSSSSVQKTVKEARLLIYAEALVKVFSDSINDKDRDFMGIPLQAKLLAEAYQEDCMMFHDSSEEKPNLPERIDILSLYQRFIKCKYGIYFKDKIDIDGYLSYGLRKSLSKSLTKTHWRLALEVLFPEDMKIFFKNKKSISFTDEELRLVGLIQHIDGGISFTHRTFAECFIADLLVNRLKKTTRHPDYHQVKEFLLVNIFKERNCVIRTFLEYKIIKEENKKLVCRWEAVCDSNVLKTTLRVSKPEKKIPFRRCSNEIENVPAVSSQDFNDHLKALENYKDVGLDKVPDFFKAILKITNINQIEQGLEKLFIIAKKNNFNKLKLSILGKVHEVIKHYINQKFCQTKDNHVTLRFELLNNFSTVKAYDPGTDWGRGIGEQVKSELEIYQKELKRYKKLEKWIQNPPQITTEFFNPLTEDKILFLRVYDIAFNLTQTEDLKKVYIFWKENYDFKELFLKIDKTAVEIVKDFLIEKKEHELLLKLLDKFENLTLSEEDMLNIYTGQKLLWLEDTGVKLCFRLRMLTPQMTKAFMLPLEANRVNGYHTKYAWKIFNGLLFPLLERGWQNNLPRIHSAYFFQMLARFFEFSLEHEVNISLNARWFEFMLKLFQTILNKSFLCNNTLALSIKSLVCILKTVDFKLIDLGSEFLVLDPISEFQFKLSLTHKSLVLKLILWLEKSNKNFEKMCEKASATIVQDSLMENLEPLWFPAKDIHSKDVQLVRSSNFSPASPHQHIAQDDIFVNLNTKSNNRSLFFSPAGQYFQQNIKRSRPGAYHIEVSSVDNPEENPKQLEAENTRLKESNKRLTIELEHYKEKEKQRKRQLDSPGSLEERATESNSSKKSRVT